MENKKDKMFLMGVFWIKISMLAIWHSISLGPLLGRNLHAEFQHVVFKWPSLYTQMI